MASPNGSQTTDQGQITPQERSRIEASVRGLEQAPSSRQQVGIFANWKQVQDQLGQPFNNERIPLSKLKLMRRDPMFAFGFHYQKMPLVKAPWYMKSQNAQVAAFMDATIRPIIASLIITQCQKLEFGFQAIAKRFQLKAPGGTYVDPESGEEKPAWNNTAGVEPVTLKPFIALPPESVEPIWDQATGEFAGIDYTPPSGGIPAGMGARAKGSGGSEGQVEIDLYHSLWVTNELESVFGNLFGYPRLGYGYPYWWSYWYRWAIADRAFEKKGDPPIVVRHPEGKIDLGDGQEVSCAEYAMMIGDRLRAGAAIAMPSTPYTNFEDRPSAVREWEIEFLKGGVELDHFDKSFDYIDVMKLRSIFVPEQALIEGGGGTSSRNVAEEMFEGLVEGQSLMMEEIVESINRWIIPHLMLVNFPQEFEQGLTCEMKVQGFSSADTELLSQLVQLIGQTEPEKLGLDVREALRQLNMPMLSEKEYQSDLKVAAEKAAAAGPPAVPATNSSAGVVPTKGRAPSTGGNTPGPASVGAGGSFTGFAYTPPIGLGIELSAVADAAATFLSDLPSSVHYQDKGMKALTKQLWNLMQHFYSFQYADFASFVADQEAIQLSDDDGEVIDFESIALAIPDVAREVGRKLVESWPGDLERLDEAISGVSSVLEKMLKRASSLTRKDASLDTTVDDEEVQSWVSSHVSDLLANAVQTIRSELTDFVSGRFNEGDADPKTMSKSVRSHFGDFPTWKASRFARTEARDAFNAGTLLTGLTNGLSVAQAVDSLGNKTDAHCEHRDGQFFTIPQALQEDEHPNGTLGWRLLRDPVTLSRVDEVPGDIPGSLGTYDPESQIIYLAKGVEPEDESKFLLAIGEKLKA